MRLGLGGPEVTIGFVDYDVPPTVRGVPAVPSASPAPELAGVVLQPTMPPPGAFAAGPIPAGDDDASSGRGGEGC